MGFGGGGSGSFVLPDHDHTNGLADGGELLQATSLIDGITLQAWLEANSKLELIEKYTEAAASATSKIFNTGAPYSQADFSKLVLIFDFVTNASMSLDVEVDASAAANYYTYGYFATQAGALTALQHSATTGFRVAGTGMLGGANRQCSGFCELYFGIAKGAANYHPQSFSVANNRSTLRTEVLSGLNTLNSIDDFSEVEVKGNWKQDSMFALYGVRA